MDGISNTPSGASRPEPWLGRLLVISLLVMLNLPAVLTGATGMDQYGFFTLEPVAVRPWPLALSIALSAASAGAGYLAYRLLKMRDWFAGNRYEAYQRNAVIFGTPVAIAFLPSFLLSSYSNKPLMLGIAGIMATSLCLIATFNDHKIHIDAAMARILFVVSAAIILLLMTLAVSGMLAMYFVEHSPSAGNFFWAWEFDWSDLGYPAEEFNQRHRNGLMAFGVAGTCYMTVALGGPLLGAILAWSRPGSAVEPDHIVTETAGPLAAELPTDRPEGRQPHPGDPPAFLVMLNGKEDSINRSQYESLLAEKDLLLPDTGLLVDKASGTAFANTGGKWKKILFRGRRKGPFLLLCVYARHPGRRFTAGELEALLKADLSDRNGFNVSDFFAQLQKRDPLVPVQRDGDGTYIPETVKVCFLDRHVPSHQTTNGTGPSQEDFYGPANGPEEPGPPFP